MVVGAPWESGWEGPEMLHGPLAPSPVLPGPEQSSTYVMTARPVPSTDRELLGAETARAGPHGARHGAAPGQDSPSELKQEDGARFSALARDSGILLTHWFLWVWMFLDCMSCTDGNLLASGPETVDVW